tara:strand:+ start:1387 stop:1584 length:198 start_codon:yes stop_codon:yes gene_type:complete
MSNKTKEADMPNVVQAITDYENGDLTDNEVVELFQHLVDTGVVWTLQGSYGRMAQYLIEQELIKG